MYIRLSIVLSDTSKETTMVDAEIVATKHKSAFKRFVKRFWVKFISHVPVDLASYQYLKTRDLDHSWDSSSSPTIRKYIVESLALSNRYSCWQPSKSEIKHFIFQISPYLESNKTKFSVRKELTPVDGDTKCSIYLEDNLDYEIYSSYVLQIVAEVNLFYLNWKKYFTEKKDIFKTFVFI